MKELNPQKYRKMLEKERLYKQKKRDEMKMKLALEEKARNDRYLAWIQHVRAKEEKAVDEDKSISATSTSASTSASILVSKATNCPNGSPKQDNVLIGSRASLRIKEQEEEKLNSWRMKQKRVNEKFRGINSFVVKQFHEIHCELMSFVSIVLSSLFMYPFRSPWSDNPEGFVITCDSTYGNDRTMNFMKASYLRQSFSKREDGESELVEVPVYGNGTGTATFGVTPSQRCCRGMSPSMLSILKIVQKAMEDYFRDDESVNSNVELNTCELILYYDEKCIRYHRDVTYSSDGKYIPSSNSQIDRTPVCILTIGDTRELDFALHNFMGTKHGGETTMQLTHGSLFFLHPNDEMDVDRPIPDAQDVLRTHYRHRSLGVAGDPHSLSVGFVFRSCKTYQVVKRLSGWYYPHVPSSTDTALMCDEVLRTYFSPENKEVREEDMKSLQSLFLRLNENWLKS